MTGTPPVQDGRIRCYLYLLWSYFTLRLAGGVPPADGYQERSSDNFATGTVRVDHQQISEPRLTMAVPCQKAIVSCELRINAASTAEMIGIK